MKLRKIDMYGEADTNGKRTKTKSAKWYGVFVDHSGVLRRLPLLRDRVASGELARTVDRLDSLKSAGTDNVLPQDLSRALEVMPKPIRERLADWAIIAPSKAAATKPLLEHLADWKMVLESRDNTAQHVFMSVSRVRRVIVGCKFVTMSDISASEVQRFLGELRKDSRVTKVIKQKGVDAEVSKTKRGLSAATFNYYLRDFKSFLTWMVDDARCSKNPMAKVKGIDAGADRRHKRRALSHEEMQWLLDVTASGAERFGMAGAERAMLYRLAVETGLRAAELRSLTRSSFRLDEDASVTIAAAYAKNRKDDTLPLRDATVPMLAVHLSGKFPATPAFNMPALDRVIDMFRADLSESRAAWLNSHQLEQDRRRAEEAGFLSTVNEQGLFADFHALRHTFITNLVSAGVNPKTVQRLARHSTITLTMDRYTHLHGDDMANALGNLPDLSAPLRQQARATGTHDLSRQSLSPNLSPNSAIHGPHGAIRRNQLPDTESALICGESAENTVITEGKASMLPAGIEPATLGFGILRSIQLSYESR
jgi:integrase